MSKFKKGIEVEVTRKNHKFYKKTGVVEKVDNMSVKPVKVKIDDEIVDFYDTDITPTYSDVKVIGTIYKVVVSLVDTISNEVLEFDIRKKTDVNYMIVLNKYDQGELKRVPMSDIDVCQKSEISNIDDLRYFAWVADKPNIKSVQHKLMEMIEQETNDIYERAVNMKTAIHKYKDK